MAKKATPHAKTHGTRIPADQMDLPVTFDVAGNVVTLRQVMEPGYGSVLSLASLSPEKRAERRAVYPPCRPVRNRVHVRNGHGG